MASDGVEADVLLGAARAPARPMASDGVEAEVLLGAGDRGAARSASRLAAAAVALSLLAVVLLAVRAPPALRGGAAEAVGLASLGPGRGWQRLYLPGAVREGPAAQAPVLRQLPAGSLVFATGAEGAGLRVSRPLAGWLPLAAPDGVRAVYPEMALRGAGEGADVREELRSDGEQALNARLRAQVAQVTAVQEKLAASMQRLRARSEGLKQHGLAHGEVGKLADVFAQGAGVAAREMRADQRLQRSIADLARSQDVRGVLQ